MTSKWEMPDYMFDEGGEKFMIRTKIILITVMFAAMSVVCAEDDDPLKTLITVYKTAPQGYPEGRDERGIPYAKPDASVWFRWHFYNDEAVQRFDDAKMDRVSQSYNPLEGQGVTVPQGSGTRFAFVSEHVTEGKQALKVDFPAGKDQAIVIQECVGPSFNPAYNPARHDVAAYWCHYHWLKFDVFNSGEAVPLEVNHVPVLAPPGASVVAVNTADAVGWKGDFCAINTDFTVQVRKPQTALTLFIDHVRMEQEVPKVIRQKGRLFHFAPRSTDQGKAGVPILWPGFTAVERDNLYDPKTGFGWTRPATKRTYSQSSFRSVENGYWWGCAENVDSPFRVDLPNGRYGIYFLPYAGSGWAELVHATGRLALKVNGREEDIYPALTAEQARRQSWAGEAWDWRPGSSLWQELVWPLSGRADKVVYADVTDGQLLLEFPYARAIIIFPEADKDEALKELGRFKYLLAESWDVSHPWVQGPFAQSTRYLGAHGEAAEPEIIPAKLRALKLAPDDFKRGFVLFQRGLAEPFYPDTLPEPEELNVKEVSSCTAPGTKECLTLSILPLAEVKGLRTTVSDLFGSDGEKIPADQIDVRVSRYHHKTMEYGHHNHGYNIMEHYLVRRPELNLYPGAARRVYLDAAVAPQAKPGKYTGRITFSTADGRTASAAIALDVLPVQLAQPPVVFLGETQHPALNDFGIRAGLDKWKDKVPPVYKISGQNYYAHEWNELLKNKVAGAATPDGIEKLRASGDAFWLIDDQKAAKEQSARFTFGFWLWRTGAAGRVTPVGLGNTGQLGKNAYHTCCDGNSGNVFRAVIDSLTPGTFNHSRDLLLLREGVDDCRFIYSLDILLKKAAEKKIAGEAFAAAGGFQEALMGDLSPDIKKYYEMRYGYYAEDWFAKPGNPWTTAKFDETRRDCARHIVALSKALGEN